MTIIVWSHPATDRSDAGPARVRRGPGAGVRAGAGAVVGASRARTPGFATDA